MKSFFLLLLVFSARMASAESIQDAPPNEPPYVTEEEVLPSADTVRTAPPVDEGPKVLKRTTDGRQFISHPLSKKGLQLIDKDGAYYYATERKSKRNQYATFRFGAIDPGPDIAAEDGTTYGTMYGEAPPFTFFFDYEWKPFQAFGELGLQAGFGLFTATGNGRFANGTGEAREKYTFIALPISLGLVYRFQYSDRQWIAPYVAGGGMYFALAETRDDDAEPNFVGTPTAYGAGGLLFNLSMISRESAFAMDTEYGIHTLWMSLEARQIQASSEDLNFTGTYFNLGFGADY